MLCFIPQEEYIENMESESELINRIFGHPAASKNEVLRLGLFISLKFVKSQNHPSLYSKMQNYCRYGEFVA